MSSDMERGLPTNVPPAEQFDDIITRMSDASRASTREGASSDPTSTRRLIRPTVTSRPTNVAARPRWLHEDEHAESSTAAATRLPSEPPTAHLLRGEPYEESTNTPTGSSDERPHTASSDEQPHTAARRNDHQAGPPVRHTPAYDRQLLEAKRGMQFAGGMAVGSAATTVFVLGILNRWV